MGLTQNGFVPEIEAGTNALFEGIAIHHCSPGHVFNRHSAHGHDDDFFIVSAARCFSGHGSGTWASVALAVVLVAVVAGTMLFWSPCRS